MTAMAIETQEEPSVQAPRALPEGWDWARLGELGKWTGGGTPSKTVESYWRNGTIPWVSPKDMKSRRIEQTEDRITEEAVHGSSTKFVESGSILIVMRSGILRHSLPVAVNAERVTMNQDLRALTPVVGFDPDYLAHYLRFIQRRVLRDCSKDGTTVQSIEASLLEKVWVPIAPVAEQRRIVARIDELFAEIAGGEVTIEQARAGLDVWRRALLKAAVTGELTRDWREANRDRQTIETAAELIKRIQAARTQTGRQKKRRPYDAEPQTGTEVLPPIPEEWAMVTWNEMGTSQNGRPFPSSKYSDAGIKLLRPGNLFSDGSVRWTNKNTRYLPLQFEKDDSDLIVRGRELVINLTAQSLRDEFLGRVCLTSEGEHCLLNQRLARLTPTIVCPEFLLIVFKSSLFRNFVSKLNSGSLIQHMFTSQIEQFAIPLPSEDEQG
jgi:type I restriction enzyme S subunit